jgi:predicted O-linked N-acetylglucosamine transferase (SPINDLY family)
VSRAGLSQTSNLGLAQHWVAQTADDFVHLAKRWALDQPRLAQLRSTLRQRMQQSPLMDAARFVRNIESAYRELWRRWCDERR